MRERENQILSETIERAKFFQTVQAWPLTEDLDYHGWLSNFKIPEEKEIACLILGFFTHFSTKMVNQMLKSSVSNAGHYFSKFFSDWKHSDFKNRCIYSFIPGETQSPTDSGNLFVRKLRDELSIPENRIVKYSDIPIILSYLNKPSPIIFVDDFVGSGEQVRKAWKENKIYIDKTLMEICKSDGHCAVYAPLIVNMAGFKVITDECDDLNLSATHVLGSEYCLFNRDCICWKNDPDLFKKGVDLIVNKSTELGIPLTGGNDVRDGKGYREQGLALSFEHGAPDAIPSIFYWNTENWTPLINKQYQR